MRSRFRIWFLKKIPLIKEDWFRKSITSFSWVASSAPLFSKMKLEFFKRETKTFLWFFFVILSIEKLFFFKKKTKFCIWFGINFGINIKIKVCFFSIIFFSKDSIELEFNGRLLQKQYPVYQLKPQYQLTNVFEPSYLTLEDVKTLGLWFCNDKVCSYYRKSNKRQIPLSALQSKYKFH